MKQRARRRILRERIFSRPRVAMWCRTYEAGYERAWANARREIL